MNLDHGPDDGPDDAGLEDGFEDRVAQSIYDMFWAPEIVRRGGLKALGGLHSALAVLPPDGPVEVRLNDEVQLAARSHDASSVRRGEVLTLENLEHLASLEPVDIDPDAGWALYAVLPDGSGVVAFDYRVNRGRADGLLARASQFYETACEAVSADRPAVAVECLYAAAELSVTAMMGLGGEGGERRRSSHGHRLSWLNYFTRLGNAPRDFHDVLKLLARWRPAARYLDPRGDEENTRRGLPSPAELAAAQEDVGALLQHSRARSAPLNTPG